MSMHPVYLVQRSLVLLADQRAAGTAEVQLAQTCLFSGDSLYEWTSAPFRVWARIHWCDEDDVTAHAALQDLRRRFWWRYRKDYCARLQQWAGTDTATLGGMSLNIYRQRIMSAGSVPSQFMMSATGPLAEVAARHPGAVCFTFYDLDACIAVAKYLAMWRPSSPDDDAGGAPAADAVIDRIELLDPFGTYRPWGHVNDLADNLYGLLQLPTWTPAATQFAYESHGHVNVALAHAFFFPVYAGQSQQQGGPVANVVHIVSKKLGWLAATEAERRILTAYKDRATYRYYETIVGTSPIGLRHFAIDVPRTATVGRSFLPAATAPVVLDKEKKEKPAPTPRGCKGDAQMMSKNKRKRSQMTLDEMMKPPDKRPRI